MSRIYRFLRSSGSIQAVCTVLIFAVTLPLQAQNQKLYLPALQGADEADLGIALINPTLTEADVTLTARSYSGAILQNDDLTNPVRLTLPASSQRALFATEIFGSGISGQTGWVELSASPAVKGLFLVLDSRMSFVDGTELTTTPSSRVIFPKVFADSR